MKKIFFLLITIILLFNSCSLGGLSFRDDFFTANDKKVANDNFEKILEAIQNHDSTSLKALFSHRAIRDSQNLNDNIIELFDFYQGQMLSYDDGGGPGVFGGKNVDGRGFIKKEMQSTFDVETSEQKYHFAIREFVQDTEFPDNVGIYAIYIVKTDELDEPVANWWMEGGVWIPGITIDLMDE